MLFNLTDQVALVTGAASGLGRGFAEVLADHGAHVALSDIDTERLSAVAADIAARGGSVETRELDIADTAAVHDLVDAVAARHGRLDIAFANAGVSAGRGYAVPEGQIEAVSPGRWDQVVRVNLTGTFATIQAAARVMRPRRYGRIIVVASIAGLKSEALVGYAYAATKAAIINLVRHAALDLARDNVLVTGIAPGPFRTNIAGGRINEPEVEAAFAAMVPLGRIAEVDEIKGLALLLASPASSFITGVTIPIDGGATAG
jgi:NAD(P)-dependent dehydrogenase (short-subunit alcohol dehydrogenase family)